MIFGNGSGRSSYRQWRRRWGRSRRYPSTSSIRYSEVARCLSAFRTRSSRSNSGTAAWARMKLISTGSRARFILHSEFGDNDEELPNDIDDEKYISIPDKTELDLGKRLVLDFAREFLPVDYDEVRHIFSRRGAYRRYKDLLVRRGALERGYDFSKKAEEAGVRWGRRGTGA